MAQAGFEPVLKKTRWCLLKRKENLTDKQKLRLLDLLRYNLKTVRAYLLKEDFQQLWDYDSAAWAGKFLDEWCRQTMRSRIEPMKKIARSLRTHRELILNYFRAQKEFWGFRRRRTAFRHESEQDSGLKPNSVPGRCRTRVGA
ncbi:MAG: transposase [Bryobacteraceae bacterium]|jgi:transposase